MELSKKILLVDDEEGFLAVIKEALEVRGFEVLAAKNAIEAGLELATRRPDLILMDIINGIMKEQNLILLDLNNI